METNLLIYIFICYILFSVLFILLFLIYKNKTHTANTINNWNTNNLIKINLVNFNPNENMITKYHAYVSVYKLVPYKSKTFLSNVGINFNFGAQYKQSYIQKETNVKYRYIKNYITLSNIFLTSQRIIIICDYYSINLKFANILSISQYNNYLKIYSTSKNAILIKFKETSDAILFIDSYNFQTLQIRRNRKLDF